VNPATNIVVAVSSYFKPTVFDRVDFIEEVLLPTIESSGLSVSRLIILVKR
jgi:hypothetical protein